MPRGHYSKKKKCWLGDNPANTPPTAMAWREMNTKQTLTVVGEEVSLEAPPNHGDNQRGQDVQWSLMVGYLVCSLGGATSISSLHKTKQTSARLMTVQGGDEDCGTQSEALWRLGTTRTRPHHSHAGLFPTFFDALTRVEGQKARHLRLQK